MLTAPLARPLTIRIEKALEYNKTHEFFKCEIQMGSLLFK